MLHQFSESTICVSLTEVARGEISPPGVVSEVQYWWTEPVWMDKLAACNKGVLVWQSDIYGGPSLN